LQQIESEIRVIAKLDHPGIIRIYEFFEDDEHYHLIMEFCSNGDLMRLIKESIKLKSPIPLDNVRAILQQLLKAVSFMNSNKVIHKDLKPENVMLVESGPSNVFPVVKVIDFGLSELFRTEQDASTTVAGTAFYMAPEIFKPPFSFKCDVWSVGVIAFFMITGYLPFFGATVSEVKSNVLYRKLQWPSTFAGTERAVDVPDNLRELVDRLLEKDPLFRPTATEALGDRWFLVEPGRTAKCARFSSHLAMNITRFSRLSPFKRAVLNLIAHMWTFEMALDIQFVFYELDKTNRGFLSIQLVAQSLEQVGISPLNALRAATSLDIAGDGAITYTSLTAALILPLLDSNKKILRCAFKCFNPTADNFITAVDAWKLMGGSRSVPADSRSEPNSFDAFRSSFEDEFRNICGIVSPHPNLTVSFNDFKKWLLSPN
jgi:serine/threonine protein kinase